MNILAQSFFGALGYNALLHGDKERASCFTRTEDTRPEFGAKLAHDWTAANSTHAIINRTGFRWTVSGELLQIPPAILDAIRAAQSVVLRIDSPGGDCRAAHMLLDALEGKAVRVECRYAASASALVVGAAPGRRVIASDGALMLHPPGICAMGDAKHLRAHADALDVEAAKWIDRLTARTGQSRETVATWLSGDDVRFDARQALAAGLVDSISPTVEVH